jgi:hypothetical protein
MRTKEIEIVEIRVEKGVDARLQSQRFFAFQYGVIGANSFIVQ